MRNQQDAPDEPDLCKKVCKESSTPEEYYLIIGIFYLISLSEFVPDAL